MTAAEAATLLKAMSYGRIGPDEAPKLAPPPLAVSSSLPFDPFGLAVERARVRKVFGLPELTDPVDIETDVWAGVERVMLGDLANWKPTGFVQFLGAGLDDG